MQITKQAVAIVSLISRNERYHYFYFSLIKYQKFLKNHEEYLWACKFTDIIN